ncbi:hypothetical protein PENTCL1PPCAC_2124 [Pristionchus entomophagus]|uniref:Zinc finger CCCH domain-containing protein 14 n=1 Tax=Pristionchus entomophagus TaxID=358040 RepID=A0AAV5SEV8_9BILA|nr:hypothetical protein PENTCL1PPCAC_2124 [Pristionchus entomophagus]
MTSSTPMLNWLRFHQCRDDFVNSYQYVLLSENIRNAKIEIQIPQFILTEELKKEEETHRESLHIRELVCQLLKRVENTNIQYSNCPDVLREFLDKRNMIPKGISNPLLNNTPFYSLPTEVKMGILVQLIQHSGAASTPIHIGTDSHSNDYYLVEGRLYMKYGKILTEMAKDDNDSGVPLNSLEEYLKNINGIWKCMSETKKMWKNIVLILENFDELNISKLISASEGKAFEMIITDDEKRNQRREFGEKMKRYQPTPQPRRGASDAPPSYEEVTRKSSAALNETKLPPLKEARNRCMHFPNCQKKDLEHRSTFHHPSESCPYFETTDCAGLYCAYKHPYCLKGKECTSLDCLYEHSASPPTLLRIFRARTEQSDDSYHSKEERTEREKPTGPPTNSRTRTKSFVQKEDEKTENNAPNYNNGRNKSREPPRDRPMYGQSTNNVLPFSKKDLRCHFFPRCNKRDQCEFAHPSVKCSAFPNCKLGRDCPFKHGTCTKDGYCDNAFCPYEHYKQQPPRVAVRYQGINGNRSTGMSRSTSISNLSMTSGEVRR